MIPRPPPLGPINIPGRFVVSPSKLQKLEITVQKTQCGSRNKEASNFISNIRKVQNNSADSGGKPSGNHSSTSKGTVKSLVLEKLHAEEKKKKSEQTDILQKLLQFKSSRPKVKRKSADNGPHMEEQDTDDVITLPDQETDASKTNEEMDAQEFFEFDRDQEKTVEKQKSPLKISGSVQRENSSDKSKSSASNSPVLSCMKTAQKSPPTVLSTRRNLFIASPLKIDCNGNELEDKEIKKGE